MQTNSLALNRKKHFFPTGGKLPLSSRQEPRADLKVGQIRGPCNIKGEIQDGGQEGRPNL